MWIKFCIHKSKHAMVNVPHPHICFALLWCHNGCDGISNYQPHDCLLNHSFRCRSKKTSKLRGLCVGNSLVTGEFPTQMASNAENISIWWRYHGSFRLHINGLYWSGLNDIYLTCGLSLWHHLPIVMSLLTLLLCFVIGPCMIVPHKWMKICWFATAN